MHYEVKLNAKKSMMNKKIKILNKYGIRPAELYWNLRPKEKTSMTDLVHKIKYAFDLLFIMDFVCIHFEFLENIALKYYLS